MLLASYACLSFKLGNLTKILSKLFLLKFELFLFSFFSERKEKHIKKRVFNFYF
jgi:hypothetical protein